MCKEMISSCNVDFEIDALQSSDGYDVSLSSLTLAQYKC